MKSKINLAPFYIEKETTLFECKLVIAKDREQAIKIANNDKKSPPWGECYEPTIEYPEVNEWDWETYHDSL